MKAINEVYITVSVINRWDIFASGAGIESKSFAKLILDFVHIACENADVGYDNEIPQVLFFTQHETSKATKYYRIPQSLADSLYTLRTKFEKALEENSAIAFERGKSILVGLNNGSISLSDFDSANYKEGARK